jgi:hypothetical protein
MNLDGSNRRLGKGVHVMRRRSLLTAALAAPLATASAVGAFQSPALAASWYSSDKYAQWTTGAYTVENNVWGSGAGSQTIWANNQSTWGVWADHPNTGGVKSYPNVGYTLGRDVWSMGNVSSNANVSVPSGAEYATCYDVWGDGWNYEIMIWTQWTSGVGPIGGYVSDVHLGYQNWAYYQGSNGSNAVHSFLARGQATDTWVDITAHCQWLVAQGRMPQVRIDKISFGFEISQSAGGKNYTCNSYSLWT